MKNQKDFFVHSSSYVDEDVQIGENTKMWHFSHIQSGSVIGEELFIRPKRQYWK